METHACACRLCLQVRYIYTHWSSLSTFGLLCMHSVTLNHVSIPLMVYLPYLGVSDIFVPWSIRQHCLVRHLKSIWVGKYEHGIRWIGCTSSLLWSDAWESDNFKGMFVVNACLSNNCWFWRERFDYKLNISLGKYLNCDDCIVY